MRDFREIYRDNLGFVWHALRRFGTAPDALEDAVQDVFVVAYRRRDSYAGASPKAWLYGISRRVASNYRRGRERLHQRRRAITDARPRSRERGVHEAILVLDRYLEGLTPEDRELFILSELEGMSGPEIAEARGRNVQTIYTRLRKLREGLAVDDGACKRARDSRPRASANAWAALMPMLGSGKAATAGWLASLTPGWAMAGWSTAAVVALTAVADPRLRASASPERPDNPPTSPATPATPTTVGAAPGAKDPSAIAAVPATVADPPGVASIVTPRSPAAAVAPHAVRTRPARTEPRPPVGSRDMPARAAASAAPTSTALSSVAASNALLRTAKAELRGGDPDAALATLAEHTRRFGGGAMDDLRGALRIEALCAQGRPQQALGEAAAFVRRHPNSPLLERVKKICRTPP